MRWEFWKAGINILKKHWLLGVGTGDVAHAFSKSYDEIKSELNPEYRLRAHNQYLTFAVALGMLGFIPILYFFFLWIKIRPKAQNRNYLAWVFLIISFLSMINEDTLETQAGVSFIVYFACLFLVLRITPLETIPIEERAK
jgi:O-antigen ligase